MKPYLCGPELLNTLIFKQMTKAELVAEISTKTGIEKTVALQAVEAAMKVIKNTMADGENVYLRGFGSFIVKKRAQKLGRIISKNTTIIIPEHNIPAFKPAKTFASKVKNAKIKKNQTTEAID
jgi:DNA-binding protein HU-beta